MVATNNAIFNTVGASISGVTNQLTVTNPSNTASSAARIQTTVGGTNAANPTINWDVGAGHTDFEMGINNATSTLTISNGTVLGTNDTWKMTTAGIRSLPLQPAFLAYTNAYINNVTGDGTIYQIAFTNTAFDQASNFTTGSSAHFTAPVTGIYAFSTTITLSGIGASHNALNSYFASSNGTVGYIFGCNPAPIHTGGNIGFSGSIIAKLSASDTMYVDIVVSGSTKTVNIQGNASPQYRCFFSGYLLG